jgi:hypothetical protein
MASESVTIDCMNRKKNTEMIVGVVLRSTMRNLIAA